LWDWGAGKAKNLRGKVLRLIQAWFNEASFEKISHARQAQSPPALIADSSSRNALSFSSARTTKRFPVAAMRVSNHRMKNAT